MTSHCHQIEKPARPAAAPALPTALAERLREWRRFPIYRERLGTGGATPPWDRIPFTVKADITRGFPRNFFPDAPDLPSLLDSESLELEFTSGTSSEQMGVLFRPGWWDAQEAEVLRLNAVAAAVFDGNPHPRRATLTTPACQGRACQTPWRAQSSRTIGATLFANQERIPFLLPDNELARMAAEIAAWEPRFLDVDPVHGVWFALYCERRGISFPSLKFVLCTYEFRSVVHRKIIERAFGVPALNLYGSTETGHLLMEDERGAMRPRPQNAFLETINEDERGIGELIVTNLTNDVMPLLRYRIGDLVERRVGQGESMIVHGRVRDALRRSDGCVVTTWQVDQCFASATGLAHYQVQQTDDGGVRLICVPERSGVPVGTTEPVSRLEALLDCRGKIAVETVPFILPSASGKFRLTSAPGRPQGGRGAPLGNGANHD